MTLDDLERSLLQKSEIVVGVPSVRECQIQTLCTCVLILGIRCCVVLVTELLATFKINFQSVR